ncbi:hypothetical protein INR49_011706 [Caranx melampygus]|nr:hypothetical protein INR49_011706 [Caranx melampygus]
MYSANGLASLPSPACPLATGSFPSLPGAPPPGVLATSGPLISAGSAREQSHIIKPFHRRVRDKLCGEYRVSRCNKRTQCFQALGSRSPRDSRSDNLSAPASPATARNDCSITPLTPSPSPRVEVRPRMACPFSVVVAIDFGTTSSGYAFSFTQDSEAIHMMKRWEGGDPGVANQKSPTCLLLTPELRFHSFGFAARDFYHDLDPEEARHWLYFDKFKMKIHSTSDLTMETELEAVNGRRVRAIEVFAHALHFFREHALKEVKDQSSSVLEGDEIRWVITVPAVWRQPAKQFMREAAYLAGLVSPDCPSSSSLLWNQRLLPFTAASSASTR